MASSDPVYRLYSSEISYFSQKVRPAFRWKRAPFVELLATTKASREVIGPRTGLAMIPVVVTPEDETWQDSSDILDALERRFPEPPLYPTTPAQRLAAYCIELWTDEFLLIPGVHWRWSYPESATKALAEFAANMGSKGGADRFAGAVQNFTRMIGVQEQTIPAIEAHTHDTLAALEAHFAVHPYLLGGHPSLADCALMGPFYGHFYNDAVPGRLLRETAPRTCHWIERMNHPGSDDVAGSWLADDEIAPTMRALLTVAGRDTAPIVLNNVRAFEEWVDTSPLTSGELPRIVGMHTSTFRGIEVERITLPYTSWMLQRVQGAYAALDGAGRATVDRTLAGTGFDDILAYSPRHRVRRNPYKVELDRTTTTV
ncbi:MAG TPA: glutathione S-transferase family protein [Candidatus Binatia bacterium]|jgi:glutathione S-transferase|nr:glutathione S-transferase family protein [Candidatus Binatia bacterium]